PTTGDLAVSNYFSSKNWTGSVAIFAKGSGKPTYYNDPISRWFAFCAYDNRGNLFVSLSNYDKGVMELPKGSKSFKKIEVADGTVVRSLQWYGGKLVLSSYNKGIRSVKLDRVKIQNGVAQIVETTTLTAGRRMPTASQFWIDGAHVVGTGRGLKGLFMWNYPAGGAPSKTINDTAYWEGVTVSR